MDTYVEKQSCRHLAYQLPAKLTAVTPTIQRTIVIIIIISQIVTYVTIWEIYNIFNLLKCFRSFALSSGCIWLISIIVT
jgi:hypothetical protein